MFSQFSERVNSKLDQLNQSISSVASSCPSSAAVCGDKLKGIGQKVRRLSSPARKLSSPVAQAGCSGARRFSQFVSGISEFIDEELDLGVWLIFITCEKLLVYHFFRIFFFPAAVTADEGFRISKRGLS